MFSSVIFVDIHEPGDGSQIGKVEINGQTIVTGNINDYQLYNPNTGNSYSYTPDEDAISVQNTNTGVSLSLEHNCNGCDKTIGLSGQRNKGFTMSGMNTDTYEWDAEGDHEATLQNSKGTKNVHN